MDSICVQLEVEVPGRSQGEHKQTNKQIETCRPKSFSKQAQNKILENYKSVR